MGRRREIKFKKKKNKNIERRRGGQQTSLLLVGVDVLRSHKLAYESGLAHSPRTQQRHGVGRDVVTTVLRRVLLLLMMVVVFVAVVVVVVAVRDRRRELFGRGVVFAGQAVAPRPTSPERIASVHDT